jgi:hippurate hydrolase
MATAAASPYNSIRLPIRTKPLPIINRIAEFHAEAAAWRRDIHQHPELLYDVHRTAGLVADRLKAFAVDEVATGIGQTGVVGVIRGRGNGAGPVIGLRADMDALPIAEATGLAYASQTPGLMHACGHDGHTAMLLGAARYLAETRNFSGTAIVIFQPAEEGGGGAKAMLDDGLMERFGIEEIYGMHNMPGIPLGHFGIRPGPLLASTDDFEIEIRGRGGHAAQPHQTVDPIVAAAAIIQALQTIVSRTLDPLDAAVVSVTRIDAGTASNVIPDAAYLSGTLRALRADTRDRIDERTRRVVSSVAAAFGATATIDIRRKYPVTSNHPDQAAFAASVAAEIAGADRVDTDTQPIMGAEDFSFMLESRPGAFILVGNGDSAGLHSPLFDFNDETIPVGSSYWAKLVEKRLAA